jgi:methylated-DNA-[protein]-cysteine S-methyltransferase
MEGQKYFGEPAGESRPASDGAPGIAEAREWLDRYFAGGRPDPAALKLAPQGTPFRHEVWSMLLEIPYGSLATYGGLAERLSERNGTRASARAVGGAVGHNPVSVVIPCHRVVGSDGSLTGYAGGLAVKARLLELEGHGAGRVPVSGKAPWGPERLSVNA